MDVKFQKQLIKKSWDVAWDCWDKGHDSLYEIFKDQAERLESELKTFQQKKEAEKNANKSSTENPKSSKKRVKSKKNLRGRKQK
jgi:hypothetical protein